jgi:cold shock protein
MGKGTLKFFAQSKIYGFITPDDGGKDISFHISAIQGATRLPDGTQVTYELVRDGATGTPKAENIRAF